jgi:alcohol dehydrogenase
MKAIQLERPESFRIIDVPEPSFPGPGEAIVRVHTVGICGTDYAGFLGKMAFFSYPRIPGHELGVEVVAVGEGVHHVRPGDRCAVEPYINCRTCYACRRGHTNCCENHQTLGVHCDGGLRPLFTLPARKLHVSKKLRFEQLALVETLAIGCHAVNRGEPRASETVLVLGAGPIGLSVIEFARLSGARVIAADLNEQRLNFVREKMGISDTIVAGPQAVEQLREMTQDQFADVVIDATGHHESMSRCFDFAAFAGRVVYVGITSRVLQFSHAPIFHRRELSLLASRNALAPDFARIISLIEEGHIDTSRWLTHHAEFLDLPRVFPDWMQPQAGVIKAVVAVPGP